MSQIWVMADKIWMMQMRRCHTAVEEQKAHYSVELIDVVYPGRIREPGSKNVEEGRKRDQSEEREVKRELPQLRDGQDTVGMQRPMTFNIHNWQEWFSSFTFVAKMPLLHNLNLPSRMVRLRESVMEERSRERRLWSSLKAKCAAQETREESRVRYG